MSNNGTSEAEQGLNVPKSDDELADAILTAVSEGNEEEMKRLFEVEISPDAEQQEEEDSDEDSSDADAENSDKEPDGQTTTSDEDSRTTTQTAPTAEERIAKLEQELANAKALAGRTPALQSRLAQLENQLKKSQAKKKEEPEESPEDKQLAERIARLKEIDPDTAAILEALQKRQATAVSNKQPEQDDDAANEHLQQEYYKLLEVHHDAGEIFQHPYWHQWKKMLRPDQREWAESTDSEKVAVALTEFKKFMSGSPGVAAPIQATARVEEDVVDATALAREKKLKRSAETSDKPVKKSPPFDKEAAFNEAYAQAAKDAGITY